MTRIYFSVWGIVAAAGGLLYLSGYWNLRSLFVVGVFCAGLVFIGIMGVLPTSIGTHSPPKNGQKSNSKGR